MQKLKTKLDKKRASGQKRDAAQASLATMDQRVVIRSRHVGSLTITGHQVTARSPHEGGTCTSAPSTEGLFAIIDGENILHAGKEGSLLLAHSAHITIGVATFFFCRLRLRYNS